MTTVYSPTCLAVITYLYEHTWESVGRRFVVCVGFAVLAVHFIIV
jgi:hypothetical protein